jgi:hypothetical protein
VAFRASYSRFYDAWATIVQLSQNFGGNWPSVNTVSGSTLNSSTVTTTISDPMALGNAGLTYYPINDFSKISGYNVQRNFKTPTFDQWNMGFEVALPSEAMLDVNYVGSNGRHSDFTVSLNVPQPGPGDVQSRRPFPYMLSQKLTQSAGDSRYNALQVTLNKRPTHGVGVLVAYTLSHSNADGCNLGASCNVTNGYNRAASYGTSDLDQTHVFSAAFTAESPFSKSPNKLLSNVAGKWALNGILQAASGKPFTVVTSSDPENIGGAWRERLNVVGDPNQGDGIHSPAKWFNTSAFAQPAPYTYGNETTNPMRSQAWHNLDMSLVRKFPLGLGEKRNMEFRADAFNIFNNVVFNIPDATLQDATFGQVLSQWNTSRQMQLALKVNF